jgi:hypothetical protein
MGESQEQTMPTVEPQEQHRWLQRLVGDWTFEGEASMGPGQPPEKFSGSESVRSLGGLWVRSEGMCPGPDGSPGTTLMALGYDPQKQRFVGTFVASMMAHMWVYDGALDEAKRVLTLDTVGPDFADPKKMVRFQDIYELASDDHRILTSRAMGEDGAWHTFMTSHYRRKT